MPDRVRDCTRRASDPDLTTPLYALRSQIDYANAVRCELGV
jgi:hypothetical protein